MTRAERILCAMLPNVYYARRELEALLALKRDAIGATLYRDLLRPGYVRKHNFGRRRFRNAVSRRLSSVAFRLTELGIAKRENAAVRLAASAKQPRLTAAGLSRSSNSIRAPSATSRHGALVAPAIFSRPQIERPA